MLERNYAVNFPLRLLAKDFSYICNAAISFGLGLNMRQTRKELTNLRSGKAAVKPCCEFPQQRSSSPVMTRCTNNSRCYTTDFESGYKVSLL